MTCPCCQIRVSPCNTKVFRIHQHRLPQKAQDYPSNNLRGYACDGCGLILITDRDSNYLGAYKVMLDRWWKHKIRKRNIISQQDALRLYKSKDYATHLSLADFMREFNWYTSGIKSTPEKESKPVDKLQNRLFE